MIDDSADEFVDQTLCTRENSYDLYLASEHDRATAVCD